MIWFANVILLLSMWLLGRRALRAGWAINLAGNWIWATVTGLKHQWDYASLSIAFVVIATYNLVKEIRHANQPGVRATRDYIKNGF